MNYFRPVNRINSLDESLVALIKNSVYQPPRSTNILLQEFITRGANDGFDNI